MNDVTFGMIVAGRIKEGQGSGWDLPQQTWQEDLQCISVKKDNRLFFLSARSKQELENLLIAKIRVGPWDYLHEITATFGFLYPLIPLLYQIYILLSGSQSRHQQLNISILPTVSWTITATDRNMALLCSLAATAESWLVMTNRSVPAFPERG